MVQPIATKTVLKGVWDVLFFSFTHPKQILVEGIDRVLTTSKGSEMSSGLETPIKL